MIDTTNPQVETPEIENVGLYNDKGEVNIEAGKDISLGNMTKTESSANNTTNIIIGGNSPDTSSDDYNPIICPDCKVELIDSEKTTELICTECGLTYPKDGYIEAKKNKDLSNEEYIDLKNALFMCEANLILRDAKKADKACKDALNIDCRSPDVWSYMAKCYFHKTPKNEIIRQGYKGVLPIINLLNVAKEADRDSPKLKSVAHEIATNLFNTVKYRFDKLYISAKTKRRWQKEDYETVMNYLNMWKQCFKIYRDIIFLETVINELSGYYGRSWIDFRVKSIDSISEGEMNFLIKEGLENERVDYEADLIVLGSVKYFQSPSYYFRELIELENLIKSVNKKYTRPTILYSHANIRDDNHTRIIQNYLKQENSLSIGSPSLNKIVKGLNQSRLNILKGLILTKRAEVETKEQEELDTLIIEEEIERKSLILGILFALGQKAIKEEVSHQIETEKHNHEVKIRTNLREYTNHKRNLQIAVISVIILLIIVAILLKKIIL